MLLYFFFFFLWSQNLIGILTLANPVAIDLENSNIPYPCIWKQVQFSNYIHGINDLFTTDNTTLPVERVDFIMKALNLTRVIQVGNVYYLDVIILGWPEHPITVVEADVVAGDELQVSETPSLAILSFVFAVLGSWTTLILLEQALFDKKRNAPLRDWLLSVFVSAASFSLCACWSTVYIALNQLQISQGDISLQFHIYLPSAIASIAGIALLSFISFALMVRSFPPLRRMSMSFEMDVQSGKDSQTLEQDAKISIPFDTIGSFSSNTNNTVPKLSKKKSKEDDSSIVDLIKDILQSFTLVSFGSGVLCFSGMVLGEALLFYSLATAATTKWNALLAVATCTSYIPFALAFQCFFHLVKYRVVGALVMAAAIVSGNQLCYLSATYYYNPDALDNNLITTDIYLLPSTFLTIAAVIGAVTAFLLQGLQFTKMKLSRNSLDLIVKKLKQQLDRSQREKDRKEFIIAQKDSKILYEKAVITTIHLLRPKTNESLSALILSVIPLLNPAYVAQLWKNKPTPKPKLKPKPVSLNINVSRQLKSMSETEENQDEFGVEPNSAKPFLDKKIQPFRHRRQFSAADPVTKPMKPGVQISTNMKIIQSQIMDDIKMHCPQKESVEVKEEKSNDLLSPLSNDDIPVVKNLDLYHQILELLTCYSECAKQASLAEKYSMHEMIQHPLVLELFKDALAKELSSENLEFWCLVREYKLIQDKTLRQLMGTQIFTLYIQQQSAFEVNISSVCRATITNSYSQKGNSCFTETVFDSAFSEIQSLMTRDSWSRFEKTFQYALALLIFGNDREAEIRLTETTNKSTENNSPVVIEISHSNITDNNSNNNNINSTKETTSIEIPSVQIHCV